MVNTVTRRYELTDSTTVFRRRPEVSWTDATGDHTVQVAASSLVGSAAAAAIVVVDQAVSRIHAELEPREDGLWVRDLGSKNGTYVEGVRVSGALVPPKGKLLLGSTVMVVAYGTRAARVELWPEPRFGKLLGASNVMRDLFAQLARIADTDSSVLIVGETGTGKELVARALHEASRRASGPYVVVDCAALPENLLESELFGHAKGAFTGAVTARAGAFEVAEGGTVFLDEIGELPLSMQPKLLRVLETRTFRRIGESTYRRADVRVVSATHRDLRTMINSGAFREDLYFRLAVLPVTVPPLRERLDDIPLLLEHLFPGSTAAGISPDLMAELTGRPWLGNVRELRNFVERARAFGTDEALAISNRESRPPVEIDAGARARPPPSAPALPPAMDEARAAHQALAARVSFDTTLREFRERWGELGDREYIRRALERHGGSVAAAANTAGVDRTYLYRCIRKHRGG